MTALNSIFPQIKLGDQNIDTVCDKVFLNMCFIVLSVSNLCVLFLSNCNSRFLICVLYGIVLYLFVCCPYEKYEV